MREHLSNEYWDAGKLEEARRDVLGRWPTLAEVSIGEAVQRHAAGGEQKNLSTLFETAKNNNDTIVYTRGGVAGLDQQIELLLHLQNEGYSDFLPSTADSYTRNEKFADAALGIEKSQAAGRSLLNGFPVVNHGVTGCSRVVDAVDKPLLLLPGTPFPQTAAEIAFAAGYSGLLGGAVSDTLRFTKTLPPAQGIANYQYVDRLVRLYGEHGVRIHREHTSFLTGALVPPCIALAVAALDCLLAAGQGVRQFSIGLGQNLSMAQDIAALQLGPSLIGEYVEKLGLGPVAILSSSHHWMGAFPENPAEALSVMGLGTAVAVLGGASCVCTKTVDEAVGVPGKEKAAESVRMAQGMIRLMRGLRYPMSTAIEDEMDLMARETRAILDATLDLGNGDPAIGAVRALEAGVLDMPWAPSNFVANKLMPARDADGAVRLLDMGNLPFSPAVVRRHKEKLQQRAARDGITDSLDMAINDVSELTRDLLASLRRD